MSDTESATFAGGCFWCTEAVFERVEGVESVTSGYAGGHVEDPSYRAVCSGSTGHAECVRIEYDPDVGSQYRSAVFYHDDTQRETIDRVIAEIAEVYDDPIVTEVEPLEAFYPAEDKHQDYYAKNPNQPYCSVNIDPKVSKLRNEFADLLAEP